MSELANFRKKLDLTQDEIAKKLEVSTSYYSKIEFKGDLHMKRYEELLQRSRAHPDDTQRSALIYILASNDDIYAKADKIYDFIEGSIKTNCLGYTNWEIEEKLNMGEKFSKRCAICKSPLKKGVDIF